MTDSTNRKAKDVSMKEIDLRYTEVGDAYPLKEWLMDPEVQRWFAMGDEAEAIDAVNRWISFTRYKCSLTALCDGVPCGMATLYLNPYKALVHQSEFGIVVARPYQQMGVGKVLLRNLMHLAKNTFHIEMLHLTVKGGSPAMAFYEKFGFVTFGEQKKWGKEPDGSYVSRVFMECDLGNLDEILAKVQ